MRKRDVLTLGLSAPSRWNPLYRRWARRRALERIARSIKALTARYGAEDPEVAGTYRLVLDEVELAFADRYAGTIAPSVDGKATKLEVVLAPPPHRFRLLWDDHGI